MPLTDNGDIIKALGFVTLYAAYLEESIDLCVDALAAVDEQVPKRLKRWPISDKLEYCKEQLEPLARGNNEMAGLIDNCSYAQSLFELRNDVVHGRIYGGLGGEPDVRRSGRSGMPDRPIDSKELYELANTLFEACSPFMHGAEFSIPRALRAS
jgi:hypothetical protein